MRKRVIEGWTHKEVLKLMKWRKGIDFCKVIQPPLIVSEPSFHSPKEFTRVRVTIEKL